MRWIGHRLQGDASIVVADTSLSVAEEIDHRAERQLDHALPNLDSVVIRTTTAASPLVDYAAPASNA